MTARRVGAAASCALVVLALALVAIFYAGSWFERRSYGPVTAQQAVAGAE